MLDDAYINEIIESFEPPAFEPVTPPPFVPEESLPALTGGALIYYRKAFLDAEIAREYFTALEPGGAAGIPWARKTIFMRGREVTEGRATAFYGDPGTTYRYSGRVNTPQDWGLDPTGTLAELRRLAEAATGAAFNFLLLNYYGPRDSIGPHSDDERDLVPGAGIFSISLGCPRLFRLEPKNGGAGHALRLAHGSALWMAGRTQSEYTHCVPAEARSVGGRVNLTFRKVLIR